MDPQLSLSLNVWTICSSYPCQSVPPWFLMRKTIDCGDGAEYGAGFYTILMISDDSRMAASSASRSSDFEVFSDPTLGTWPYIQHWHWPASDVTNLPMVHLPRSWSWLMGINSLFWRKNAGFIAHQPRSILFINSKRNGRGKVLPFCSDHWLGRTQQWRQQSVQNCEQKY